MHGDGGHAFLVQHQSGFLAQDGPSMKGDEYINLIK